MANSGLNLNYDRLLQSVGDSLDKGRSEAAIAVNIAMVHIYWEMSRQIDKLD